MWRPGSVPTRCSRTGSPAPSRSGRRRREPPPELDGDAECDPPIDRVDAAAFAGRSLAERLHAGSDAGVGCTRLLIHAGTANGEELSRVWRCAEPLTEDATADRIRWQLDGWLTGRSEPGRPRPSCCCGSTRRGDYRRGAATAPVGRGRERPTRARRALVRVQGLLGRRPCGPVLSGGRGPAERITLVPFGDESVPRADPSKPWPGRLPEPSPTTARRAPSTLPDRDGTAVR